MIFRMLRESGYNFRRHYNVEGKPDIAFPKWKIAVFVDGEFWHGKNFAEWKTSLSPFWLTKIQGNIIRDKKISALLKDKGWRILRLWTKDILKNPHKAHAKIINFIDKFSG